MQAISLADLAPEDLQTTEEIVDQSPSQTICQSYNGSNVVFRLLRMESWGPALMNLGYYPFHGALSFFNAFCNQERAQQRLVMKSIDLLGVDAGNHVLDIACGRGKSSFILRCMQPAATVVGMDLLDANVQVARTLFDHVDRLRYITGNAMNLDFADASFDRALCLEAAFHFPDRQRFLEEAYRVLRPGGRLIVVDFAWNSDADHARRFDPETRLVRQIWNWEDMYSIAEYERVANQTGFRVLAREDWSGRVTGPIQEIFELTSYLGNRSWGRKLLEWKTPLFRSITTDDWQAAARAVRAHRHVRKHTRYMAYLLEKGANAI